MAENTIPGKGSVLDRDQVRPPAFHGDDHTYVVTGLTRTEALAYQEALMEGAVDPFLGQAWDWIAIRQQRDAKGRFTSQWSVIVEIKRPDGSEEY